MARSPRFHRSGAFYHIIVRGNNCQSIFFSPDDKFFFCSLLEEGINRFGQRIHGFCLMDNHVHLILQAGETSFSQFMHNLLFRYSQYINKKEKRIGHLFQGRFKSILVEEKTYLQELIRYIHLNPVEAKIVTKPEHYFWSSHEAYLGKRNLEWVSQHWILAKFDSHLDSARERYNEFIQRGMEKGFIPMKTLEYGTHKGALLGNDDFIEHVLHTDALEEKKTSPSVEDLINIVCEVLEISPSCIRESQQDRKVIRARAIIAVFVRNNPDTTLRSFAQLVGKSEGTLSQQANQIMQQTKCDANLALVFEQIKEKLQKKEQEQGSGGSGVSALKI